MDRPGSALRLPAGKASALALILPYPSATHANPGVISPDCALPPLAFLLLCFGFDNICMFTCMECDVEPPPPLHILGSVCGSAAHCALDKQPQVCGFF